MSLWQAYLDDAIFSFRKHKDFAEKAFNQLDTDEAFFRKLGEHSNSVALILKHLAGNLSSRWTDFLNTDGDKSWRDRDSEFVIGPDDTHAALLADWERGWQTLLQTLAMLQESDALRVITIGGEPHTVLQAIQRALTHTAYHVGQIVYLARLLKTENWHWITIPPGQSKQGKPYLQ